MLERPRREPDCSDDTAATAPAQAA